MVFVISIQQSFGMKSLFGENTKHGVEGAVSMWLIMPHTRAARVCVHVCVNVGSDVSAVGSTCSDRLITKSFRKQETLFSFVAKV